MSTRAPIGLALGEARRREAAAAARKAKYQSTPEKREIIAAILDKRDAVMAQQQAEKVAEQQARPDAIRAVLHHASVDELQELLRTVGQLDGRRLAEIVGDTLRQRQRTGYVPPQKLATEAPPVPDVSLPRRPSRRA